MGYLRTQVIRHTRRNDAYGKQSNVGALIAEALDGKPVSGRPTSRGFDRDGLLAKPCSSGTTTMMLNYLTRFG